MRARAGGLPGSVEEIGQHPDAALLDLGGAGVLGVVDEVAVEVLRDDPLRLGLHPGGHEGREVVLRITVQGQVLPDQPHRVLPGIPRAGKLVLGYLLG